MFIKKDSNNNYSLASQSDYKISARAEQIEGNIYKVSYFAAFLLSFLRFF